MNKIINCEFNHIDLQDSSTSGITIADNNLLFTVFNFKHVKGCEKIPAEKYVHSCLFLFEECEFIEYNDFKKSTVIWENENFARRDYQKFFFGSYLIKDNKYFELEIYAKTFNLVLLNELKCLESPFNLKREINSHKFLQ